MAPMRDEDLENRLGGRRNPRRDDKRGEYDVDYGRIVHSSAFRRLQAKTQIFNIGDSDFYRTRLTHSMEVSQVAYGILLKLKQTRLISEERRNLLPEHSLIAAICAAHDLGHPPFGHGGEIALNYCMDGRGGFEGNGQTLRILTHLENFGNCGLDLTRRTLLGCLKYPACYTDTYNANFPRRNPLGHWPHSLMHRDDHKPPKCYLDTERDTVQWLLNPLSDSDRDRFTMAVRENAQKHRKPKYKTLDCSVMDMADDISYGVHDLEDAIKFNLVSEVDFKKSINNINLDDFNSQSGYANGQLIRDLFHRDRKKAIGALINYFIAKTTIHIVDSNFDEPLLKYNVKFTNRNVAPILDCLKKIVVDKVIHHHNVQQLESKGRKMIIEVFDIIASDPKRYLPFEYRDRLDKDDDNHRVVCDYIAGMSDTYLLKTYERLCSPGVGSSFDF